MVRSFFVAACPVAAVVSVSTGVDTEWSAPPMPIKPSNPRPFEAEADILDAGTEETRLAPAPAPIAGTNFDAEDTWMTFGLGGEGEEEDRTVTVVFPRFTEERDATDEFQAEPFSPTYPGGKRR